MKILFGDNKIDAQEWRFFLTGASGEIESIANPTDWLDDLEWTQVHKQLYVMDTQLPAFAGILEYFINFHKKFKKIFDAQDAHTEPLPGEWNTKLNSLQKMLVLKSIRPDKVVAALQNYIMEQIGKQYIEPPPFKLGACFKDSTNVTPLIFVLSSGSDPVASFMKLCQDNDMMNRFDTISLGQGQAKKAEAKLENGRNKGWWILLQNCHLCVSWLPKLEAIVEQLVETNHIDYRIWMTSMPTPAFPVSVLQNSVKMTMEPPSGLKANILQTYENFENSTLNDSRKPDQFKKILFAFAFFHAIVQDRRKFGAIGWNIPYAFTFEDFDVCRRQLKIFTDLYDTIPYEVLVILGADVNYGGRVTDDKDVRLIKAIL
jgi:dynein heavy chain